MSPSGLLHIPDIAKQRVDHGVVKYLGADTEDARISEEVRVGELVLFSGYTGTLVAINKELLIIVPWEFVTAVMMFDSTPVPGLYFQDEDGEYFEATYEQAMELLALAIRDTEWHNKLDLKIEQPKKEDYNKRENNPAKRAK